MTGLQITRTLTQADFDRFAAVSGDTNPIHVDAAFSARTAFGRNVSHGMLLYAVFWGLLRCAFPGSRQRSQSLMFPNPAFAGEPLVFSATETRRTDTEVRLEILISRVADHAVVCSGESVLELRS